MLNCFQSKPQVLRQNYVALIVQTVETNMKTRCDGLDTFKENTKTLYATYRITEC